MKKLRIASGGIAHETNTFSPLKTTYNEFLRWKTTGETQLTDRFGDWRPEGVDLLSTLQTHTPPGGLVEKTAYLRLKKRFLAALKQVLPLDGLHLDLHGAMEVEGIGDAEGDLAGSMRDLVGEDVLISVSLDLHGNISPALVNHTNILTAYRTAPHRDGFATRCRAMSLLVDSLKKKKHPQSVLVKIPLLLAGEQAVTEKEPAYSLYNRLDEFSGLPGILDASFLVGCPWADSPFTSCSVIVVAEEAEKRETAVRYASGFAQEIWDKREEFKICDETASVDTAIKRALESKVRPVFISDSGDNITAGAPGDITLIAKRLLDFKVEDALVAGIIDPEAVEKCSVAGTGSTIPLSIGGKIDRNHGRPLQVSGKIMHIHWENTEGGRKAIFALVKIQALHMLLQADRRCIGDRATIESGGIDPMKQKIVVVKQGYLYPDLADHAPYSIIAMSPGATDLRLDQLEYKNISRPIYPLDPDLVHFKIKRI